MEVGGRKVNGGVLALLSAVCYGASVPLMKTLEQGMSASYGSSLLYLGCGLCMVLVRGTDALRAQRPQRGAALTRREVPLVVLMIGLSTASAITLLAGIRLSSASTASLLGNFEVVATALVANAVFHERMGRRMWVAVVAITVASLILSWSPGSAIVLSPGALLILLACAIWGTENNVTRMLSGKDVVSVTMIKGFGTASTCALIGLLFDRSSLSLIPSVLVVLVGFVSYGVSIMLYITAQRHLGAARTGNYYSIAPFVGVIASWVMYGVEPSATFLLALAFSLFGVILTSMDVRRETSTGQRR